jgi:hypothetical protein
VLDQRLEYTASVVNALVDLLEEDEKKQDLLASWKGFEIEVSIFRTNKGAKLISWCD